MLLSQKVFESEDDFIVLKAGGDDILTFVKGLSAFQVYTHPSSAVTNPQLLLCKGMRQHLIDLPPDLGNEIFVSELRNLINTFFAAHSGEDQGLYLSYNTILHSTCCDVEFQLLFLSQSNCPMCILNKPFVISLADLSFSVWILDLDSNDFPTDVVPISRTLPSLCVRRRPDRKFTLVEGHDATEWLHLFDELTAATLKYQLNQFHKAWQKYLDKRLAYHSKVLDDQSNRDEVFDAALSELREERNLSLTCRALESAASRLEEDMREMW